MTSSLSAVRERAREARTIRDDARLTPTVFTALELQHLLGVGRSPAYSIARQIGFRTGRRHLRISIDEAAAFIARQAGPPQKTSKTTTTEDR